MTKLKSQINVKGTNFQENKNKLEVDLKLTREAVDFAMNGGGHKLN